MSLTVVMQMSDPDLRVGGWARLQMSEKMPVAWDDGDAKSVSSVREGHLFDGNDTGFEEAAAGPDDARYAAEQSAPGHLHLGQAGTNAASPSSAPRPTKSSPKPPTVNNHPSRDTDAGADTGR